MDIIKRLAAIAGVLGVLIALWLVFAPVNDISKQFALTYTENATDNLTAIAYDNGTISAYNEFQEGFANSLWFIIATGIVIIAILVVTNQSNTGGE
jgi:hypothetical protein